MRLNFKKYGSVGPNLIILHGLLGSSQNWHTLAQQFGKEYRVIVPDLRNHGDSPHGEHSIELMRQDILQLLDEERISKCVLMGHSMGGLVAMSFAFAHPERLRALIVLDIAPEAPIGRMNWVFEALESVDLSRVEKRTDADRQLAKKIADPGVRQFLLQNLKRQDDGTYAWRCNLPELHRSVESADRFKPKARAEYSGPTLFIGGERSEHQIADKEEIIAKYFPNVELVMIPGAGHWVHVDAMEAFVEVVREFMKS